MSDATPANSGARKASIGCVVLASGLSTRFGGENKLLADFHGKPLFDRILSALPSDLFTGVAVVTPYTEIARKARERGFDVVANDDPRAGAGYTTKLGLSHLHHQHRLDACMFCVCDQPYLQPESVRRLVASFDGGIVALGWDGRKGNPVVFGREFFDALSQLPDNRGGSFVIQAHPRALRVVDAVCKLELADLDTADQNSRLRAVRNFFLTGPKRSGKTTVLMGTLEEHGLFPTGLISLSYTIGGRQAGYYMHAFSASVSPDANDKPFSVHVDGGAIAIPEVFERCCTRYVRAAIEDERRVILLDELGFLEGSSPLFQQAALDALDCPKPVVGALRDGDVPWLRRIRSRDDTLVLWMDAKSRATAHETLRSFLEKALRQE